MKWVTVVLAALSLASEVLKYLTEKEKNKKERAKKLVRLKDGFKKARLEGDTSHIELAFTDVGIDLGINKDERLSDSERKA